MKQHSAVQQLIIASLLLALGLVLPIFTMQIPEIGNKLLPMHLPIILCGFILNWKYGLFLGFVTPILRSILFSMPIMFPTAIAMGFELATYGCTIALLYKHSSKDLKSIYMSLILSMIAGRVVWGLVMMLIMSFTHGSFSFAIFFTSALINAIPGIALQLVIVPFLVHKIQTSKRLIQ